MTASGQPASSPPRDGGFVDLVVASAFSFLRGASMPEEIVSAAAGLGVEAVALTDRHSVAGMVRAHAAAIEAGIRLVPGTRVELWRDPVAAAAGDDWERRSPFSPPSDRLDVVLHAASARGWAAICRLLTIGKRRAPKGRCRLVVHDLLEHHADVLVTMLDGGPVGDAFRLEAIEGFAGLTRLVDENALSIGVRRLDGPQDDRRLEAAVRLGRRFGVPLLAHNDVHLHEASRRPVQDVLTCVRHGCTIEEAGARLHPNDERRLRDAGAMRHRFADVPEAIERTIEIAERCRGWSLADLRYRYPSEIVPEGETPMSHLRRLVTSGARERFGPTVPESVVDRLEHEFEIIQDLDYARYFLTVHDIVRFARSRGILCQGRGAAANSAVCYCLGVTAVDPTRIDMLFERFVSRERDEPPDIDIDFEHERREEVIQYVYGRYGRDRAALVAEVISYRGRSAIRDVGTALGLSRDLVQRLAADIEWWSDGVVDEDRIRALGVDPGSPTIRRLCSIARAILGFPRHLSQHVGGFVIADRPLWEIVPVENAAMPDRTVIEWDKDDVDAMGMLKVDCLALGMLSCIRKAMAMASADRTGRPADRLAARTGPRRLELHTIPAEDPEVYDMVSAADTVGVFQIESRAQMSMLPRLRPRCFYDLVIEVAIVRPGPIQGQMVHPYLRRRQGREPVSYPDDAVRRVLEKTLGVPLFQEQAMALAVVAAGFTPGEADALRRAIAAWKRHGNAIAAFGERLEEGMVARGYDRTFARQVFTQIQGFSGYGFPESHAASFALLVYASSWLKCREPAAFAAALVNSQPMGFYAPAQIIRDAQEHGVEVRRIDILASDWDCTLERTPATPWDRWDGPSRSGRRSVPARRGDRDDDRHRHGSTAEVRADVGPGGRRGRASDDVSESAPGDRRPRHRRTVAVDQPAVRLGLRLVRGLSEVDARRLVAAVRSGWGRPGPEDRSDAPAGDRHASSGGASRGVPGAGPTSLAALHRRARVPISVLRRLARADAFRSMGLDRQRALWELQRLRDEALPLFDGMFEIAGTAEVVATSDGPESHDGRRIDLTVGEVGGRADDCVEGGVDHEPMHDDRASSSGIEEADATLPPVSTLRSIVDDYASIGLSLDRHPVGCLRSTLDRRGVRPAAQLDDPIATPDGARFAVAGVVLVRQRPSTAGGIVFMTLEDETGIANLVLKPKVYRRWRPIARHAVALVAFGRVERRGAVVHLVVGRVESMPGEESPSSTPGRSTSTIGVVASADEGDGRHAGSGHGFSGVDAAKAPGPDDPTSSVRSADSVRIVDHVGSTDDRDGISHWRVATRAFR